MSTVSGVIRPGWLITAWMAPPGAAVSAFPAPQAAHCPRYVTPSPAAPAPIRCGCVSHVARTTWLTQPRRMPGGTGPGNTRRGMKDPGQTGTEEPEAAGEANGTEAGPAAAGSQAALPAAGPGYHRGPRPRLAHLQRPDPRRMPSERAMNKP